MSTQQTEKNGQPSTMGWFRQYYAVNPKDLWTRSNDKIISAWMQEHPGYEKMPKNVRNNLANVKSMLKAKHKTKKKAPAKAVPSANGKPHGSPLVSAFEIQSEGFVSALLERKNRLVEQVDHINEVLGVIDKVITDSIV